MLCAAGGSYIGSHDPGGRCSLGEMEEEMRRASCCCLGCSVQQGVRIA